MKIHTVLLPNTHDELAYTGKVVVVIDVLRATSTIVRAFMNGAKEVVPVGTLEFGLKASGSSAGGKMLRGGERNMVKIDGFNLGNSPLEYERETVEDKSIVFLTTNGTKAIVKTKFSEQTIICSFQNLKTVAHYAVHLGQDVVTLCSGRNGEFSLEDTVCAGRLIQEIASIKKDVELTDSALAARAISKSMGRSLKKVLSETEHGRLLVENGFEEDIAYCAKLNTTTVIPVFSNNAIRQLPEETIADILPKETTADKAHGKKEKK